MNVKNINIEGGGLEVNNGQTKQVRPVELSSEDLWGLVFSIEKDPIGSKVLYQ